MSGILGISVVAVLLASAALAQNSQNPPRVGDPAYGSLIAETWCSACHLVEADERRAVNVDVPTFTSIARRLPSDVDVLIAFVANPHPPMPNLGLSRQDVRDVLAYIATLK